jgi:class 3 adenylate cyclase/predicted ATPase
MDVAAWLRDLGLERYVSAFRDNDIDAEVLLKLTAEDLISIGVTSVGHRRKLLDAIAGLGMAVPTAVAAAPAPGAPAQAEAERRQLTVMFCDLVGSTALSTRFDPEDLRELIGDYHRAVADTVGRFDGFVAKYMGDGVLVYFGYPRAHEDDAERAVRAGLAVIEAVGRLPVRQDLRVRLGIATGLAVVGDLIGEGAAQERGVVGETPNLAARLQALAEPNTLVIAESTRRQLGSLFDVQDLGPQALAGFTELQGAWRVVGESGVVSRFEALRSDATPLIGRDEELELLRRRWVQAKAGEGRVVLVSGEPGIGKSRLTAAIGAAIKGEQPLPLRWFCSPHNQDSALYPFIVQLERAAGFARDDSAEERLAKLNSVLAPGAPGADDIALVSELLSLPNTAADLNLSPQRKREKLFEALLHQLEALSRDRPVLAAFEDAHWIDPTSRELLDLMVDQVRRLPVLLIITFRLEFQAAWGGQPHVTTLALNRLGQREVAALVRGLAGNAPLGSEVVEEIVERTDGVPLFIEELTKAVLERADQDNRVAAVLSASPLPRLAVPSTLHASLIARLDRIGTAPKEIAQVGAVLGREFSYELIEPVAQRSEAELQAALNRLTEVGLLFCRGTPPHSSYLFKHALVQDAAYGTLLRSHRQELHARVAAVLEQDFSDLVERQPELLAHHLTGAAETERAVAQWLKAGQFAAARSAHPEAIGHFGKGLAALASMPDGPARDRQETELQLARGLSLLTARGFASVEAVEAYARARALCEKSGDADHLFVALWNLWMTTAVRDVNAARPLSARLLSLTETEKDTGLRLEAHHSGWFTHFYAGEPAQARHHCDEGRRLYDVDQHRSLAFQYGGHDAGVCARNHSGLCTWLLGYPDQALAESDDAVDLASRLAHPLSLNHSILYNGIIHLFRREPGIVRQRMHDAEDAAREQRLALALDVDILRGGALLIEGATEEAAQSSQRGLAARRSDGWQLFRPYQLVVAAEVLCSANELDGATDALVEARTAAKASNERWWEAEILRLHGLLLLAQNKVDESQAAFERALHVARAQQARSLELRAAVSLARLWGETAKRAEAHQLLAPVFGWFTEGFDTPDLKEAKALLDQLA